MRSSAVAAAFDPMRLRVARLSAGLRTNQLADLAGVTPAAVSQFEHGHSKPSASTVAKLALGLGVPVAFFARSRTLDGIDESRAHFRSMRSASALERGQALAHAVLTMDVVRILEQHVRLPKRDIPAVSAADDMEGAADRVRDLWGLGDEPVPHVVRLLEAHGIVVTRLALRTSKIDAFSYDFGAVPVVVLASGKNDMARSRFDAAHELGHLVCHHDAQPGNSLVERQAHTFAAALLAPAHVIRDHLPARFDVSRYIELKQVWGVSIQALLYRAKTLGVMTDASYRRAVTTIAKEGWRQNEPGDLGPAEESSLLVRALELTTNRGFDLAALADAACLEEGRIRELVGSSLRPFVGDGVIPANQQEHTA